ncbi:hypothetical protein BCR42DRAFT_496074 [Absidia repens]|uniref:Heterokaryon incompatibility domain-containing protein n=1 Tax=Absidia repens TaxID=90262 RepID=A0A1X2I1L3_9FUNG|nr:hypothetical protein BCR42DRAFT_496074 [Absidia repens]
MTKEDPVEHLFQELTCDDTQQQQRQKQRQQQKPFKIVLVDIKKAAGRRIHCIEKPLEGNTKELRFIALSYRWGELEEKLIDTRLGYLASITSFDLNDFYWLCTMMTKEPDLASIQYVWVDAICVDQTNHERRKATIHQMSNIYERATYILAVPDLHKTHCMNISKASQDVMDKLRKHQEYIYHLIQGNSEKLIELDNAFFDAAGVPKEEEDPVVRQLVTSISNTTLNRAEKYSNDFYNVIDELVVEQLYDLSRSRTHHPWTATAVPATSSKKQKNKTKSRTDHYASVKNVFHRSGVERANKWLYRFVWKATKNTAENTLTVPWRHAVVKRNKGILKAMALLDDLISDWSSRVWVISEYHIAKKKNNLKYWFIELHRLGYVPFFKFDFEDATKSYSMKIPDIHRRFHQTMIKQLNEKDFLEKILNSKASKNEDRFYAILPQTKYKDNISQVGHWNINSMVSIKLKLFEILDTKDKLELLFLVGKDYITYSSSQILPTFATSNIRFYDTPHLADAPLNFDLHNTSMITMHHRKHDSQQLYYYYLCLTPKRYSVVRKPHHKRIYRNGNNRKDILCNYFQLDERNLKIDFVRITLFDEKLLSPNDRKTCHGCEMYLAGSFSENIWIFDFYDAFYWESYAWNHYDNVDNVKVFNIY